MSDEQEQAERAAVVAEAREWLRTPFHHRACVKGAGVDCAMLLIGVYPQALSWIPREIPVPEYPRDWHLHRDTELYLNIVQGYARELPEGEIGGPGDLVVFRYGRTYAHGGIIVQWPLIIHAYLPARMVTLEDAFANKDLAGRARRFFSPWRQA